MNESLWHHRTAVPNVVDAPELAFHVKAFYLALRQYVPGGESAGIEALDLLGSYAADAGRQLAELEADQEELVRIREQSRILECERAELEDRLSELSAELERSVESHAEEQRRRRRLEVELETTRAALRRRELPAPRTAPAPGQARESQLVAEIRARARELVPPDATALVAGKGDDTLLQLNGCRAWHFPMAADGGYAGYHPASDTAVIAQLEALRARGADHLLLAATTLWWLDHYEGLRRHLDDHYARLLIDESAPFIGSAPQSKPVKRPDSHARAHRRLLADTHRPRSLDPRLADRARYRRAASGDAGVRTPRQAGRTPVPR